MNSPRDEADLLLRARALAGRTLAELSAAPLPNDQRRAKGVVGELLERALGTDTRRNAKGPDFAALGVELKSIPVASCGTPKESTYVCTMRLADIASTEWALSPVRAKLTRVLFVPVEHDDAIPLPARRVGAAFLWSPSRDEERALADDWDDIAGRIGRGDVERLDARIGKVMQVRPKGAHGRVRTTTLDDEGLLVRAMPRGFYLRATFTKSLVFRAIT